MNKNGSSAISTTLTTIFCIFLLTIFAITIIRIIMPLLIYHKMQTIVVKYMYVIEKYGYLTHTEYTSLLNEIIACGIDGNSVNIEYPSSPQNYGTLLKLKVEGNYTNKLIVLGDSFSQKLTTTNISVIKYSYSKI